MGTRCPLQPSKHVAEMYCRAENLPLRRKDLFWGPPSLCLEGESAPGEHYNTFPQTLEAVIQATVKQAQKWEQADRLFVFPSHLLPADAIALPWLSSDNVSEIKPDSEMVMLGPHRGPTLERVPALLLHSSALPAKLILDPPLECLVIAAFSHFNRDQIHHRVQDLSRVLLPHELNTLNRAITIFDPAFWVADRDHHYSRYLFDIIIPAALWRIVAQPGSSQVPFGKQSVGRMWPSLHGGELPV